MKQIDSYCTGCLYKPMCGKSKEIQMQQNIASQQVKRFDTTGNITFCLDRVINPGSENECIRIFIGDQEVSEYYAEVLKNVGEKNRDKRATEDDSD